jgi:5-methylcytosine-specific restriction protein B
MGLGVLSREAIERAIAEYDELGRDAFLSKHGFGRATAYALVVDGREYDPKAIAGVAYGLDHPDEGTPKNADFNGGLQLRSALRPAGFDVTLRTTPDSFSFRDLLEQFMGTYGDARNGPFAGEHPVKTTIRGLADAFRQTGPLTTRPNISVKFSVGLGNWAAAPWIAFLDDRVTSTTTAGVYPVLLFREDMSGLYMTVAQGTQQMKQFGRQHMLSELALSSARVRDHVGPDLVSRGFKADNTITLGPGGLARDYEASTIVHKLYERDQIPDDATILQDLDAVLDLSDADIESSTAGEPGEASAGGLGQLASVISSFRGAVDESGLKIPSGQGDRVTSFMCALVSKPFVILSGMSGSGKTQLAMRVGEWFGAGPHGRRFLSVAVRPDWTGPESLFGYEDALRPPLDGQAAWFVPRTLEFLIAAAEEPDMPYLLLLDEMNLAHVERYFSDFLSGIESRDAIVPNLNRGDDGEWRLKNTTESLIPLPRNVFVVGTVNVDETTYQFSPKVLDRATTFEVRTATAELSDDVSRPTAVAPAEVTHLRTIVNLAIDDTWQIASEHRTEIAGSLRDLHGRLSDSDDEFGHRVFHESLRLTAALEQVGVSTRDALLDHVVLLKVLPRIHGSRRRAEPVLKRLAAFAADPEGPADADPSTMTAPALPMTMSKVRRMLRSVEINQFVSFTD